VFASVLVMGLEARAAFRVIWVGQVWGLGAMLVCAVAIAATRSWWPLVLGLVVTIALVHLVQVVLAGGVGMLDRGVVLRTYGYATGIGAALLVESAAVVTLTSSGALSLLNVAALTAAGAVLLWRRRDRLRLLPVQW
jgi:hypothetical protein